MAFKQMIKASRLVSGVALFSMLLGAGVAGASITYDVNQVIGAGSVIGTITTDGVLGTLVAGDFTAWNLVLTGAGGANFTLTNGTSGVEVGNVSDPYNPHAGTADVTADIHNIYFNFDGGDGGYLGFQQAPLYAGQQYWCNASTGQGYDCSVGKSVVPAAYNDPSSQYAFAGGKQIIASVATGGVPEPTAWALMVVGFAGLGVALRRRRGQAALIA
jgi:hypothetical protein